MSEPDALHPAEHRAYRELYASSRQLINRWQRLEDALADTVYAAVLRQGLTRVEQLLVALAPTTEVYGLHGGIAAQGLGARIADVRGIVTDRSVDTGMVMRFAVLDIEHVATLLAYLERLAGQREDEQLRAFLAGWGERMRAHEGTIRDIAIGLGDAPAAAIAPCAPGLAGRVAHGLATRIGTLGEWFDRRSLR